MSTIDKSIEIESRLLITLKGVSMDNEEGRVGK
jgi:hypothetical protein